MCAYLHLCVENVEGRVGWEGQDPHQLVLGGSILDLYLIKQVPVEEITMLATGQELANMNKKKIFEVRCRKNPAGQICFVTVKSDAHPKAPFENLQI